MTDNDKKLCGFAIDADIQNCLALPYDQECYIITCPHDAPDQSGFYIVYRLTKYEADYYNSSIAVNTGRTASLAKDLQNGIIQFDSEHLEAILFYPGTGELIDDLEAYCNCNCCR